MNEIFYSLQGEGANSGVAAVFVRFSGCNLACEFCDTSHHDGVPMSDEQIVDAINAYPQAPLVVLTGGEPSLFIDEAFVAKLKGSTHKRIAIETNGTRTLPTNIDWVTLSPKCGVVGGELQPLVLNVCDELKVVYQGQDLEQYFAIEAKHYYLQPCFTSDAERREANLKATVEAVMRDARWRLSLQIHRVLNIR